MSTSTLFDPKKHVFTNRIIGDTVYMLLDRGIGPDPNDTSPFIYGSLFSDEMYYWKSQGFNVQVKVNCLGGSVVEGWSIIDAIRSTNANTQDVGVAFSMGGICLMFGKHRTAYDYASCMIHAPRGGHKEFLEIVKKQFKELLETRTKFTADEIKEMIDSGKDYFFTATEMLEKGIIDEIIPTEKGFTAPSNAAEAKNLFAVFNSALQSESQNNKNTEMEIWNTIKESVLGAKTDAEGMKNAMQLKSDNDSLRLKNGQLETENKDLKGKVEQYENAAKVEANKTKAKELIEGAEKSGKMTFKDAAEKEKAIVNATENYDAVKIMIDGIPSKKPVSAASTINADGKSTELTYAYLANNDPKKLQEIQETDPQLYAKLVKEWQEETRTKKA